MIDNIKQIKSLLNFEQKGDFYMLYVMKRKKDQPEEERNQHQSVRTIKSYSIGSLEYLDKRYDEIKQLCEIFKARAYIHVQKQNHNDVALEMLPEIVKRIQSGQIEQQHVFDSVVGKLKTYEKRWVVDIDTKDANIITNIIKSINYCRPQEDKIITNIQTKNGVHLITKRFDVKQFKKIHPDIDIQKKNPTLLYYPNSLDINIEQELTTSFTEEPEFHIGKIINFNNGQQYISAEVDNITYETRGMDRLETIYLKYNNGHVVKFKKAELIKLM